MIVIAVLAIIYARNAANVLSAEIVTAVYVTIYAKYAVIVHIAEIAHVRLLAHTTYVLVGAANA